MDQGSGMTAVPERILVTGATGFLGSWLCRKLVDAGHAVTGTARRPPAQSSLFERLDLSGSVEIVAEAERSLRDVVGSSRPERIFHLAGQADVRAALADPCGSFEANTALVWRLVEAVRAEASGARIVHVSTDGIYGEAGSTASSEDTVFAAVGPYDASKAAGDIVACSYAKSYRMNLVVARLGNVYGPGDSHRSRLVPSLMDAVRAGRAPILRTATAIRSFVHLDDVIDALTLLSERADVEGVRTEAFNVTSPSHHTTLEVAILAAEAFGRTDLRPTVAGETVGEVSVKRSSPARIQACLGWRAKIDLREGLARMALHPLEIAL